MKSRFVRTSSRSMLIIKSYEKGAGGRRGAEETQWSQWKLKERENMKGRGRGEHIHQWLWLAGAGEGRLRVWSRERSHCSILRLFFIAKLARLWPTARLVLWSGANRFIFSAQSPLCLCVGCKVDYSLEKGFCHHAVGAPTTGSNHPAALTVPASSECSAYDVNMPLQTNSPVMQSLLTRLWRIVIAWNDLLHDSVNNVYVQRSICKNYEINCVFLLGIFTFLWPKALCVQVVCGRLVAGAREDVNVKFKVYLSETIYKNINLMQWEAMHCIRFT